MLRSHLPRSTLVALSAPLHLKPFAAPAPTCTLPMTAALGAMNAVSSTDGATPLSARCVSAGVKASLGFRRPCIAPPSASIAAPTPRMALPVIRNASCILKGVEGGVGGARWTKSRCLG